MVIFTMMETIPKSVCEKVGFLRKTHGVNGELVLEFEPRYEYSIENKNRFFVEIDGLLVPFFTLENGFRFKTENTAILSFEGVETEKYAKRLVGSQVFLYKTEIKDDEDDFLVSDIEGYLLVDEFLGEIGIIGQVNNYAGNIVLTIIYQEKELLVPFNDDLLVSFNKKNKTICLKLPDGIFDI